MPLTPQASQALVSVAGDAPIPTEHYRTLDYVAETAFASYAVRLMRDDHLQSATPYSMRVRSTDPAAPAFSAGVEIGFDVNGDIDEAALSAAILTGDGEVEVLYDQSGSDLHLTPMESNNRPRIAIGGALLRDIMTGVPYVSFQNNAALRVAVPDTWCAAACIVSQWSMEGRPVRNAETGRNTNRFWDFSTQDSWKTESVSHSKMNFHWNSPGSRNAINGPYAELHGSYHQFCPHVFWWDEAKPIDGNTCQEITGSFVVAVKSETSYATRPTMDMIQLGRMDATTNPRAWRLVEWSYFESRIDDWSEAVDAMNKYVGEPLYLGVQPDPSWHTWSTGGDFPDPLVIYYTWQRKMYDRLLVRSPEDYDLPQIAPLPTTDGNYGTDTDLHQAWAWMNAMRNTHENSIAEFVNQAGGFFVRDDGNGRGFSVAGDNRIRRQGRYQSGCELWSKVSLPMSGVEQNIYREGEVSGDAIRNRIEQMLLLDMIWVSWIQINSPNYTNSYWRGLGSLRGHCTSVRRLWHTFDDELKDLIREAFWRQIDTVRTVGNDYDLANMHMKSLTTCATGWHIVETAWQKQICIDAAKQILFGSPSGASSPNDTLATSDQDRGGDQAATYRWGTASQYGGILEGAGPSWDYQGQAEEAIMEAYAEVRDEPEWSFLHDIVVQMSDFNQYHYISSAGGNQFGPCASMNRTTKSCPEKQGLDQWSKLSYVEASPQTGFAQYFMNDRYPHDESKLETDGELITNINRLPADWNDKGLGVLTDNAPGSKITDSQPHWMPLGSYIPKDPNFYNAMRTWAADPAYSVRPWQDDNTEVDYKPPKHTYRGVEQPHQYWFRKTASPNPIFGFVVSTTTSGAFGSWQQSVELATYPTGYGHFLYSKHDKSGADYFGDKENTSYTRLVDEFAAHHVWGRAVENSEATTRPFYQWDGETLASASARVTNNQTAFTVVMPNVRIQHTPTEDNVLVCESGESGNYGWEFGLRNNGNNDPFLYAKVWSDGATICDGMTSSDSDDKISRGVANDLAFTFDNGTITLYRNFSGGTPSANLLKSPEQIPEATGTVPVMHNTTAPLRLGGTGEALGRKYLGNIDREAEHYEVGIFNRALTREEIGDYMDNASLSGSVATAAANYVCRDGYGGTIADNSGNGHDLTIVGNEKWRYRSFSTLYRNPTGPGLDVNGDLSSMDMDWSVTDGTANSPQWIEQEATSGPSYGHNFEGVPTGGTSWLRETGYLFEDDHTFRVRFTHDTDRLTVTHTLETVPGADQFRELWCTLPINLGWDPNQSNQLSQPLGTLEFKNGAGDTWTPLPSGLDGNGDPQIVIADRIRARRTPNINPDGTNPYNEDYGTYTPVEHFGEVLLDGPREVKWRKTWVQTYQQPDNHTACVQVSLMTQGTIGTPTLWPATVQFSFHVLHSPDTTP